MAVIGVGSISASFFLTKVKDKLNINLGICLAFLVEGLSIFFISYVKNIYSLYAIMLIFGVAVATAGICLNTLIQKEVPKDFFSRTNTIFSFLLGISVPLGYIVGGLAVENIELSYVFTVSGLSIILVSLYSFKVLKA